VHTEAGGRVQPHVDASLGAAVHVSGVHHVSVAAFFRVSIF
jgi:hypothetical protein